MTRKLFIILIAAATAVSLGGCATAKKKFIRKKQEQVVRPVIFTEEGYQKEFSNKYYYGNHFTYYKTWHDELIRYWGKNAKRERRSADEMISNLESMRDLLKEPKHSELDGWIDKVRGAKSQIQQDRRTLPLRLELDKVKREISNAFSYDKVKEYIVPDDVTLDAPPSGQPAPAAP